MPGAVHNLRLESGIGSLLERLQGTCSSLDYWLLVVGLTLLDIYKGFPPSRLLLLLHLFQSTMARMEWPPWTTPCHETPQTSAREWQVHDVTVGERCLSYCVLQGWGTQGGLFGPEELG